MIVFKPQQFAACIMLAILLHFACPSVVTPAHGVSTTTLGRSLLADHGFETHRPPQKAITSQTTVAFVRSGTAITNGTISSPHRQQDNTNTDTAACTRSFGPDSPDEPGVEPASCLLLDPVSTTEDPIPCTRAFGQARIGGIVPASCLSLDPISTPEDSASLPPLPEVTTQDSPFTLWTSFLPPISASDLTSSTSTSPISTTLQQSTDVFSTSSSEQVQEPTSGTFPQNSTEGTSESTKTSTTLSSLNTTSTTIDTSGPTSTLTTPSTYNDIRCHREICLNSYLLINRISSDGHRNPDNSEQQRDHKRNHGDSGNFSPIPSTDELESFELRVGEHAVGLEMLSRVDSRRIEEIDDIRGGITTKVIRFDALSENQRSGAELHGILPLDTVPPLEWVHAHLDLINAHQASRDDHLTETSLELHPGIPHAQMFERLRVAVVFRRFLVECYRHQHRIAADEDD
ncbi:hypothetical protein E2P81_ATG10536 [Venturia nashicola]|nr:hypothetical protein E2P81_ATG10536 [Venturia nashicola]